MRFITYKQLLLSVITNLSILFMRFKHTKGYSSSWYNQTFNSLYEILTITTEEEELFIGLSILFMRFSSKADCVLIPWLVIFQFSLWDSAEWDFDTIPIYYLSILFMRFKFDQFPILVVGRLSILFMRFLGFCCFGWISGKLSILFMRFSHYS